MKISEHDEMMAHLTKPGTPEQKAKLKANNKKETENRTANKRAEYGLSPQKPDVLDYINKKIDMYQGGGVKIDPPIMERRGEQTLALKQIGKKVLDGGNLKPEDVELKLNENGLHTNKDRTIAVRDSFVANAFNKSLGIKPNYPTQATPKQFGELSERLERERQMRGEPTNVQMFEKNFNQKIKPFVKKKISTPIEAVKINMDTYEPFIPIDIPKRDPQMIENEKRFNRMQDEIKQEKDRINNSGLAGLMGGAKNGE